MQLARRILNRHPKTSTSRASAWRSFVNAPRTRTLPRARSMTRDDVMSSHMGPHGQAPTNAMDRQTQSGATKRPPLTNAASPPNAAGPPSATAVGRQHTSVGPLSTGQPPAETRVQTFIDPARNEGKPDSLPKPLKWLQVISGAGSLRTCCIPQRRGKLWVSHGDQPHTGMYHVLEERRGVWNPKLCGPKMAQFNPIQYNISFCEFHFSPV